ncbi:MAG TPA: 3-hydroxyacyl-CoA dehydrogenase family protein [Holophagaceae bacterium]|nr:3-hydroxyacyl-CoA dehydrogenase family protein [Holophagaceae bacterium]
MILAVLGPGALGRSLARHAASRGISVRLVGRDEAHAQRALEQLGKRGGDVSRIHARGYEAAAFEGVDALLEALPEDMDGKAAAWRALAPLLPMTALRLTGSSSLPVSTLDTAAGLGGRLMAFHLFVPVGRMGVVELVAPAGVPVSDRARAASLASALDLRLVQVQDGPGYAAARMGLAQGLEAMRLLEAGVATAEDLDALMVNGYGHPVGPLELSDRVGLDLRLAIAERLFAETGDTRFEPPRILREKVAEGAFGRKAGRGFFAWDADRRRR